MQGLGSNPVTMAGPPALQRALLPRVARGEVSIWSVTMEDGRGETGNWRMVTVEVHNASKRVVQARGRHNRLVTPAERRILERWAALSALTVHA